MFSADGTVVDGAINADLTSSKFIAFEIKITGFESDQKDVKLALGAYVATTKDGATEYSYIQESAPTGDDKYSFASYNDVVASLSKE